MRLILAMEHASLESSSDFTCISIKRTNQTISAISRASTFTRTQPVSILLMLDMFSVANPHLPQGCEAGGPIWNPDSLEDHYYPLEDAVVNDGKVPFPGALKNVKNNVEE